MDLTDLQWWQNNVKAEWAVVSGAPFLFGISVLVASVLLWLYWRGHYQERIASLEAANDALQATIGHKESVLSEYRDKLDGATPAEVAAEITDLKAKVSGLIAKIIVPQRGLTAEQRNKLVAGLKNEPSLQSMNIAIGSPPDQESTRYAGAIAAAVQEGGMVVCARPYGVHDEGEYGVVLYGDPDKSVPQFRLFTEILDKTGIPFTKRIDPAFPTNSYLFVCPEEN